MLNRLSPGEPRHFIGLAEAYGPFLPTVHHPFVLRDAGRAAPQKGLPEHGPSKASTESGVSQKFTAGPSRAGDLTSAQPAANCWWKRRVKGNQQPPKKSAVF